MSQFQSSNPSDLNTQSLPTKFKARSQARVAIVHDWLTVNGGAEKVLMQFCELFPSADIYTLVNQLEPENSAWLKGHRIITSFIDRLPLVKKGHQKYLPLFALAIEQFDLSKYDVILSSSYCVAKGVITSPDQTHICYCHSPARYAWELQHQYLKETNNKKGIKSWFIRYVLHRFRIWDRSSATSVDQFIANSKFVAGRIKKFYGRDAIVINPPVDLINFDVQPEKKSFYLAASRLVPYKKLDLIVDAFCQMPDKNLKLIGKGPQFAMIQEKAKGHSNIEIMGFQPDDVLYQAMKDAKAFVFAAEEDFGIIPVEAQACGTPVIAFRKGGAVETVIDQESGVFFDEQTVEALIEAVNRFETCKFDPQVVRASAERFSVPAFKNAIQEVVDRVQPWTDQVIKGKS